MIFIMNIWSKSGINIKTKKKHLKARWSPPINCCSSFKQSNDVQYGYLHADEDHMRMNHSMTVVPFHGML